MDKTSLNFSTTEDEQLIEMVHMHEYLYDAKHPSNNDLSIRETAWQEISQIIERPVAICKKRWKNIKDAHRRRKKLGKLGRTSKSPLVKLVAFLDNVETRTRDSNHKLNEFEKTTNIKIEKIDKGHGSSSIASSTIKKEENHISEENYDFDNDDTLDENINNESITDNEATTDFTDPLSTYESSQQEKPFIQLSTGNVLNVMQRDLKMIKTMVDKQEDSVDLFFRSLSMSVKNLQPHLINEAKVKMLQLVIDLETQNNYPQTQLNENEKETEN